MTRIEKLRNDLAAMLNNRMLIEYYGNISSTKLNDDIERCKQEIALIEHTNKELAGELLK